MAEIKRITGVEEPLIDEDPVVEVLPEVFDPTRITMNENDRVDPAGFFKIDFDQKSIKTNTLRYVAINLPKAIANYKQLARLAQFNVYRPCPGAVKSTLTPCPAVFGIRVYPSGDCPRVEQLVRNGYMDFIIDPHLLPVRARANRRAVIKSATLVAYKTTGLHYPTRLSLIVEEKRVLGMQNGPGVLTNWDSDPDKVVGTHIEPDQEMRQVAGGTCSLGACDVTKIAWYSRLAGIKDAGGEIIRDLAALPAWGDDPNVAKIRIAGEDKTKYTFLQWLVGHHWMYCWHMLAEYWCKLELPLDTTEFPVPYQDKTTKETFVPIHRDSVKKLLDLIVNVLRHRGSFDIAHGVKLRLAFDKESKAYKDMARERDKALKSGLVEEFDHHSERFRVCFDLQMEFLTYQVGDDAKEEVEEDVMREQERAISRLSDDAALFVLEQTAVGGRVRALRGTAAF